MGLSQYPSPADGGILCALLINTAMSLSMVKGMFCSMLHVVGIHITSQEDNAPQDPFIDRSSTAECLPTPIESYMKKFRIQTPAVRYDTVYNTCRGHGSQECVVCLTEFVADAEINVLSCGHFFHKACVEKWVKYWNFTCPLCRHYMMSPLGEKEDENTCPM